MAKTWDSAVDFVDQYFAQRAGEPNHEYLLRQPRLSLVLHAMEGKGPRREEEWFCHLCKQHIPPQSMFATMHKACGEVACDAVFCDVCVEKLLDEAEEPFLRDPLDPNVFVRPKYQAREVWAMIQGFLPR